MKIWAAIFGVTSALAPFGASANIVPSAQSSVNYSLSPHYLDCNAGCDFGSTKGGSALGIGGSSSYGSAYGFAIGNQNGTVTATASTSSADAYATANADLSYFVEIVGAPNTLVPIHISGLLGFNIDHYSSYRNQVSAVASVATDFNSRVELATYMPPFGPAEYLAFDFVDTVATNTPFGIYLHAGVYSYGDAAVSASADPIISFDSGFADSSQFSILVSDGVTNSASSVPEPATVALVGLALACFAVGRRTGRH